MFANFTDRCRYLIKKCIPNLPLDVGTSQPSLNEFESTIKRNKDRLIAAERWKILARALRQREVDHDVPLQSVRRFSTFGLLEIKRNESYDDSEEEWYECCALCNPNVSVMIRYLKRTVLPQDLIGFNNTGNVCIWPSEEILAYYCLKYNYIFEGKSICELGGGMTCLGGLLLAIGSEANEILLTDGNCLSVSNVEKIIKKNKKKFGSTSVNCRVLQWDCNEHSDDLKSNFDFVLCADCLFFSAGRLQLLETILKILKPKGEALILAPVRSNTLNEFEDLAKTKTKVQRVKNYDSHIWDLYNKFKTENKEFNEDLHYPILLRIIKE